MGCEVPCAEYGKFFPKYRNTARIKNNKGNHEQYSYLFKEDGQQTAPSVSRQESCQGL